MTPHQCWNVCDWGQPKKTNRAKLSLPTCAQRKSGNQSSDCGHHTFEKRYTSSFQPSELLTQTRWHKRRDGTPSFQRHTMFKMCQNFETSFPERLCFTPRALISSEIKVLIAVSPRVLAIPQSSLPSSPPHALAKTSSVNCSVNDRVFLTQYFDSADYFLLGRLASFVEFFRCLHFRECLFLLELSDASCHTFLSHTVFQVRFLEYVLHLQPR